MSDTIVTAAYCTYVPNLNAGRKRDVRCKYLSSLGIRKYVASDEGDPRVSPPPGSFKTATWNAIIPGVIFAQRK